MRERLVRAATKNALLAAALSAVMIYRLGGRGVRVGRTPVLLYLLVVFGLTFLVATAWQVRSRVDRWSWTSTAGGFFLSFAGVSAATVVVLRLAVALR